MSAPGTEDWQETAAAWLGAVEGTRQGFRATRSELGAVVSAEVTDALLSELVAEGQRLSNALRAVELVESALRFNAVQGS